VSSNWWQIPRHDLRWVRSHPVLGCAAAQSSSTVTLSGISAACVGRHVAVALTGSDGRPMASISTQVAGAETTMNVPETSTVAAEQLGGVSVVITD